VVGHRAPIFWLSASLPASDNHIKDSAPTIKLCPPWGIRTDKILAPAISKHSLRSPDDS